MGYGNGNTGVGAVTSVYAGEQTIKRQPIIAEQMMTLEQRSETLAQLVAELEARIDPILIATPPDNKKDSGAAPHPGVAFGASLAQMNDRLALIGGRLRAIIERVEL